MYFSAAFVAPAVVIAPVVLSGGSVIIPAVSTGNYDYNPFATLPYLQLPDWTISALYGVIGNSIFYFKILPQNSNHLTVCPEHFK